ncbi:Tat (twin-arginine translocation) pathway signal sequence [Trichlorobacter thiogenes]|uniref:Tat (Twin-arginine translocation) pathway signal sequence n=1 Tax=Trichlorobacter thiogenes TaxID=115783 RepID=A0A1T4PM88_9BACT|nr:molybdopterin-dependent oxidoreductase [Trichlorobacter thiogenes]SJZ92660.1 Tat (twin-arginine translocation) pathway signal sequence [Trichlorobacter thiogenes]
MEINRRDFLKVTAAAGAVATVGLPKLNAFAASEGKTSGVTAGEWIPSTCQGCTAWCPVEFFVQDNRISKVRGNQLSKANNGYCCPRGHLMIQQTYDPDRIKVPMKRTNPQKGKGVDPKFVPISWDEALDTIADKMMELRKNNEPHKFMYMRGRYSPTSTDLAYGSIAKIFGSPNSFSHSAICAEAEKMGPGYTQGFFGYRDYDLAKTKCLVVWGCDPLSSNRQVPNAINKFGDLLDRGTLIAVDPRMSTSTTKAHQWLPIKPGEDGALAAAIAHVLLTEGFWSKEFVGDFKEGKNLFKAGAVLDEAAFVEKQTHGLIKWWNLALKDATPAWAAKKSLIPEKQIIAVARTMGKAGSACAVWMGPGVAMSPRGTYASMFIYALNGILGSVETEGGVFQSSSAPGTKFPEISDKFLDETAKKFGKEKKLDGRGAKDMPAIMGGFDSKKDKDGKVTESPKAGVVTNNIANGMLKNPGAVKVCIATWNNFNFSATGASRWDKAMAQVPFFAHVVTNASEMSQFADIVLPATFAPTEKLSILNNMANLHGHLSIQQPVAKPLWQVKSEETEFVWLLAEKLKARGFSNLYDYYASFEDPETKQKPTNAAEFCEIAARISSQKVWNGKEKLKGDKIASWAEFKKKGIYNSETYAYKKNWGKFKTVTQKFEFYSETLKKTLTLFAAKHKTSIDDVLKSSGYEAQGELVFVPHYETPKRWGSEKEYPFTFIDHKSRLNREGRSANTVWYQEFKKLDAGDVSWDDVAKINPADAKKLGIKDGDTIRLTSPTASIITKAKLWEGVRPGTVAKCFGQGHWAYGRTAAKDYAKAQPRGGNNNELMPDDYDRLSGATARNGGFTGVKIEKV